MLGNEDWFGQSGFFVVVDDRIPRRTTFFARVAANKSPSYDPPKGFSINLFYMGYDSDNIM